MRTETTPGPSSITSAIVFVGVGLVAGIQALDLFDAPSTGEFVKVLAEATLALVLFSDASRIDLRALRREYTVPARLLGIGLPLTIVLGAIFASFIFDQLSLTEAAARGHILRAKGVDPAAAFMARHSHFLERSS